MDVSQLAYIIALAVALLCGREGAVVTCFMVLNFGATMLMAGDPTIVGCFDLLSAIALIGISRRANMVAVLFCLMIPIYVMGFAFGWPKATTYTCIDLLAYAQLGVIGGLDRGVHGMRRAIGRLLHSADYPAPRRGQSGDGVARIDQPDCGAE